MHKLQPKQVNKLFGHIHYPEKFASGVSTSQTVTSTMTDCFTLYSVENKLSSGITDTGVDGTRVKLMYAANNAPIMTSLGEEVYGVLTKVLTVWTINYKYLSQADGNVYDYTFTANTDAIFSYIYRAQLGKVWNDINSFQQIQNTRKMYIELDNDQLITVDYNPEYFGQLPIVQGIDDSGNSFVAPFSVDSVTNCTQISFDFGVPISGYLIIC